jgi:hypothetical protein
MPVDEAQSGNTQTAIAAADSLDGVRDVHEEMWKVFRLAHVQNASYQMILTGGCGDWRGSGMGALCRWLNRPQIPILLFDKAAAASPPAGRLRYGLCRHQGSWQALWLDWATIRFRFYQPSSFNTALRLVLRPHFLVHFV